ncbi:HalOD1 output domain-containing protein [Natronococcus jeotgali]|uniref:HalOD1 output domain-containing protein n=1 Tax=Natronococcus jeotgali TaxID=413812 RepID=UPI0009FD12A0|nr:HalOD1 output domain-containing protein [Natronococcus jeotgali]
MSSIDSPVQYTCREDDPVSQTVITAVAEASNCDPCELDPLYEYIDPDALNTLFHLHSSDEANQDEVSLEFTYTTYRVTVTANSVHISHVEGT